MNLKACKAREYKSKKNYYSYQIVPLIFKLLEIAIYLNFAIRFTRTFVSIFQGSLRGSWGFSEYLTNYSQGFVRRGLPGGFLVFLNTHLSLDPYLVLVIFLLVLYVAAILITIQVFASEEKSKLFLPLIFAMPTLFLAPLQDPSSFIRKDFLIFFLLILIAAYVEETFKNIVSSSEFTYKILLLMAVISLGVLSHETMILTIPIIYIWLSRELHHFNFERMERMNLILKFALIFPITSFVASIIFHGSSNKAALMIQGIPTQIKFTEGGLLSNGWIFSQSFSLVKLMFQSHMTIASYAILMAIGPGVLLFFGSKFSYKNRNLLWLSYSLPLVLFFIGWDWGRWLEYTSFFVLAQIMINVRTGNHVNTAIFKKENWNSRFIICIAFLELLIVVPGCCTQSHLPFVFV